MKVVSIRTCIVKMLMAALFLFWIMSLGVKAETKYEYDDLNRLIVEQQNDGTTIYYEYDGNGNLINIIVKNFEETSVEKEEPDIKDVEGGSNAGDTKELSGTETGSYERGVQIPAGNMNKTQGQYDMQHEEIADDMGHATDELSDQDKEPTQPLKEEKSRQSLWILIMSVILLFLGIVILEYKRMKKSGKNI